MALPGSTMFRYPDFFKVGIAESGNHDNRVYEDDWGERYQGLLVRQGATDNYATEANQSLAKNLKGKLLLAHGTVDDNVPPDNTTLVVDALTQLVTQYFGDADRNPPAGAQRYGSHQLRHPFAQAPKIFS